MPTLKVISGILVHKTDQLQPTQHGKGWPNLSNQVTMCSLVVIRKVHFEGEAKGEIFSITSAFIPSITAYSDNEERNLDEQRTKKLDESRNFSNTENTVNACGWVDKRMDKGATNAEFSAIHDISRNGCLLPTIKNHRVLRLEQSHHLLSGKRHLKAPAALLTLCSITCIHLPPSLFLLVFAATCKIY